MTNTNLFKKTIHQQNISRILLVGSIYTLFELLGIALSTLGYFDSDIRFYVGIIVTVHIIYLSLLWIARKNNKTNMLMEYFYYFMILYWGVIFTVLVLIEHRDITVYSVIALLLPAIMVIDPKISRILYTTGFILLSGFIYSGSINVLSANAIIFKALIVTVLSWVISDRNYKVREDLHISQQHLESANLRLQNQNLRDSMTGLYNNAYIFDLLDKTIESLQETPGNLSVLMIDIDDFKVINDSHGHLFGDDVIKRTATKLNDMIRSSDTIARYGGEEFLIILNDTSYELTIEIAERIRKSIEEISFIEESLTISIGVCEWDGQSTKELIDIADTRLYKAKNSGKNKVVFR